VVETGEVAAVDHPARSAEAVVAAVRLVPLAGAEGVVRRAPSVAEVAGHPGRSILAGAVRRDLSAEEAHPARSAGAVHPDRTISVVVARRDLSAAVAPRALWAAVICCVLSQAVATPRARPAAACAHSEVVILRDR
jgi:hypothetical protein